LGEDFEPIDGQVITTGGTEEAVFVIDAVTADDHDYEYRVIVAGDPTTLTNKNCRVASDAIVLHVIKHQPVLANTGAQVLCAGDSTTLSVTLTDQTADLSEYVFVWESSVNQVD